MAYAISKGVVVVAAMGNDGSSTPSYPAAYPDVIAVGAVQSSEARAAFSQTGPHIDVSAPGVGILSTYLAGGLATLNGTSMATPHVAGVAALVKAVKPGLTAAEIGDILRSTAKPLKDAAADPVPNDKYGWGLVDASAAVLKARGPIVINPTLTVKRGEEIRVIVRNQDPGITHALGIVSLAASIERISPGATASLSFRAPTEVGRHEYVCPPHAEMMRGVLLVTD